MSGGTIEAAPRPSRDAPLLALQHLETLWLQVTGTLCNLTCRHCFITCGPNNHSHPFMTVAQVGQALEDASALGTREYYFTGGEPFMHPEILTLIDMALARGPLTILTNGVLIDGAMAGALRERFDAARYSLDLRVSLDGTTAQVNDPIRGRGTFDAILTGVRALGAVGLNPVLTVTEIDGGANVESREAFRDLLRSIGLDKPRLKFLAPFRIGREERRGRPYDRFEILADGDLLDGEESRLQCSSCRAVTARGAWPCPILVEVPGARIADRVADALAPIRLSHPACHTCHVEGISCRT